MVKRLKFTEQKEAPKVKLDLGCGKGAHTPEGFQGVDIVPAKGVKVVDLTKRWPWRANSVDEVHSNYLLHFLTPEQRKHFMNELHRVLKPGATAAIITPMWSANKAYADADVQWPPVSEGWFHSLTKEWRAAQNYEVRGLTCDFEVNAVYGMHPAMMSRNADYQQTAMAFWKEAAQDLHVTLTKR